MLDSMLNLISNASESGDGSWVTIIGTLLASALGLVGMWSAKALLQKINDFYTEWSKNSEEKNDKLSDYRKSLAQMLDKISESEIKNTATLDSFHQIISGQIIPHLAVSRDNQEELNTKLDKVVSIQKEDNLDTLSSEVSISTVLVSIGHFNAQTSIWYETREKINHIIKEFNSVNSRYATKKSGLRSKIITHFKKYKELNGWIDQEGAELMSGFLFSALISYQYSKAKSEPTSYSTHTEILDRWQSLWGDACRAWHGNNITLSAWIRQSDVKNQMDGICSDPVFLSDIK